MNNFIRLAIPAIVASIIIAPLTLLIVGATLSIFNNVGLPYFQYELLAWGVAVAAASYVVPVLIGCFTALDYKETSQKYAWVILVAVLSVTIYMMTTSPVFGWDVLHARAHHAFYIVESKQDAIALGKGATTYDYYFHHSLTMPFLYAVLADYSPYAVQLASLLAYLALALIAYSYIYLHTQKHDIAIFLGYIFCSIPLIESHAIVAGYAELWLAYLVALGVFVTDIQAIRYRAKFVLSVGIIFLLVYVKVTGALYASGLLLYTLLRWQRGKSRIAYPPALISIALVLATTGWWYAHDLIAGGKWLMNELSPNPHSIAQVFDAQVGAYLKHQSFGILFSIFFVAVLLALQSFQYGVPPGDKLSAAITVLLFFGLALFLYESLTDKGFRHAVFNSDTGKSRMTIPMVPFFLPVIFSLVSTTYRARPTCMETSRI